MLPPTMLRTVPALIPCILFTLPQWARRESNPRPGPYKRPALTTELRAASGAEGPRTLACRIKSSVCCRRPCCARCPHDPRMLVGRIRINRVWSMRLLLISSGSPESRTQRHSVISRVRATGPRLPFASRLGAHLSRSGPGGARIRVCGFSGRRRPTFGRCPRLSYRPKRKKPDVVVTPGFWYSSGNGTA